MYLLYRINTPTPKPANNTSNELNIRRIWFRFPGPPGFGRGMVGVTVGASVGGGSVAVGVAVTVAVGSSVDVAV